MPELSPLSVRDRRVIARVVRRINTAGNLNREVQHQLTFGTRLADRVASLGGS